jgi:molybdenum cofactor biosynthesis protein B
MGHQEHRERAPKSARCAVLTVSDSRSRETDDSGKLIMNLLRDHAHEVVHYTVVKDDVEAIRGELAALRDAADAQAVIVNGGTGFSRRDVTREAVEALFDRELEGFGELFRYLSYRDIGPAAMLSRATAGIIGAMIVFLVPGSPKAAELAMKQLILPEITHLVYEVGR